MFYRGNFSRHSFGGTCQYWDSDVPNGRAAWADRFYIDAVGRHNNCRNTNADMHGRKRWRDAPWCIPSEKLASGQAREVLCNVPRCVECNYGDGAGEYPGIFVNFISTDGRV